MIVGNGDIASALKEVDRDDMLFFASGVSNSQEIREEEYKREANLLLNQYEAKHFVYFSSLSVFYNNNRYTKHKLEMEEYVKENLSAWGYTIIRLGNITWGSNPHTFINHFKKQMQETGTYVLPEDRANESRYILEKDEFLHWINLIPAWSCEMNIPGIRMTVQDAIERYGHA